VVSDLVFYGIDPSDPIYDVDRQEHRPGPRCGVCNGHPKANRRVGCDLEAARAADMDDPRWCVWCKRCFDLRSCATPDCLNTWVGTCGDCQAELEKLKQPRKRRGGLSPARAQKVRLSDPDRSLDLYSDEERSLEAYDEVRS